jgi:hypothetical protein
MGVVVLRRFFRRWPSASALVAVMPVGVVTLMGHHLVTSGTRDIRVKNLDHFGFRDVDAWCRHPLGGGGGGGCRGASVPFCPAVLKFASMLGSSLGAFRPALVVLDGLLSFTCALVGSGPGTRYRLAGRRSTALSERIGGPF